MFFKSTRDIFKSAKIIAEKTSVFFRSPTELVSIYQFVKHRRQYLSKFISRYSKIVSNCQSLSVRTVQSVRLCQTFSVMAVQYQYLSKFVR